MRFYSLALLIATAILASACGSDSSDGSNNSTSRQFSSLPPVTIGDVNPVDIADGELPYAFAAVDDDARNRWLVADELQGIIAIDKTSNASTVILAISSDDQETLLTSVSDIALDSVNSVLYVLDTERRIATATSSSTSSSSTNSTTSSVSSGSSSSIDTSNTLGHIIAIDLTNDTSKTAIARTDITIDNNDDSYFYQSILPSSLFFDETNNRLLIGDRAGLLISIDSTAAFVFCVFTFSPTDGTVGVLAEEKNLDNPVNPLSDVRDIYYDAEEDMLYTSGTFSIGASTGEYLYQGIRINASTWNRQTFYLEDSTLSDIAIRANARSTLYNSIAYDRNTQHAYLFNQFEQQLLAINLPDLDDDRLIIRTYPMTGPSYAEDRPLILISDLLYDVDNGLRAFDAGLNSFFQLETDNVIFPDSSSSSDSSNSSSANSSLSSNDSDSSSSAASSSSVFTASERTPLFVGTPLPENSLSQPQRPLDIVHNGTSLIISDGNPNQPDAFIFTGTYESLDFSLDLDGITGTDFTPTDEQKANGPSITRPKPFFIAYNTTTQDTLFYGGAFQQKTDDEDKWFTYRPALYIKKQGEESARPISTFVDEDDEDKLKLLDVAQVFNQGTIIDIALSTEAAFVATSNALYAWVLDTQELILINPDDPFFNPPEKNKNITAIAVDETSNRILVSDSSLDNIVSIESNFRTDIEPEVSVVSGLGQNTPQAEHYLALPVGLAIDENSGIAYTFENSIRALISIDMETGQRERLDSNPNFIRSASAITLSNDGSTVYVLEKGQNRILSIDIATGTQTWIDSI